MKSIIYSLLLSLFLIGCGEGGGTYVVEPPSYDNTVTNYNSYVLSYIVDGDTAEFEDLGRTRFISIDTPEVYESDRLTYQADNCAGGDTDLIISMGTQSSNHLKEILIPGDLYYLELYDKDIYGRTIVKVYKDNQSVNLRMVSEGYAVPYIYTEGQDPDEEDILNAMNEAKENQRGLWLDYADEMECLSNL